VKAIVFENKHTWREIQTVTGLEETELNRALAVLYNSGALVRLDKQYFVNTELINEYLDYQKKIQQQSEIQPIEPAKKVEKKTETPIQTSEFNRSKIIFVILIISGLVVGGVSSALVYTDRISKLNNQLNERDLELEVSSQQIITLQEEAIRLSNDVTILEYNINHSKATINNLNSSLTNANNALEVIKTEKNELQYSYDQTLVENYQLRTSAIRLTKDLNNSRSYTNELETNLTLTQNTIIYLENQILSLESQLDGSNSNGGSSTPDFIYVETSFSRPQDTSARLQYWIGQAEESIKIMMYLITQNELADALKDAYDRGVQITVIIDDDWVSSSGSDYQELLDYGIDIRNDERTGGLMHHKVVIIDDYIVIVGSYNWSASAEDKNDENILILKSTEIANDYLKEFERIIVQTSSSSPPPPPPPSTDYELTISKSGSGTTNPSLGVHTYDEGSYISVTAIPSSGWNFDHWVLDGQNVGSQNPYGLTMNDDHDLEAVFEEETQQQGDVVINEFEQNPPGNDNYGSVYEWVELYNRGGSPVDISGWTLMATGGSPVTKTISQGTVLQPGQRKVIQSGSQWLDNSDEKVVLKDDQGTIIDQTPTKSDGENDARSWQRSSDGSNSWVFKTSTKNAPN
jgi:hypothetical protein